MSNSESKANHGVTVSVNQVCEETIPRLCIGDVSVNQVCEETKTMYWRCSHLGEEEEDQRKYGWITSTQTR